MSAGEKECRYASDDDVVARYVLGELDEGPAEAFEEHFFACDRCWSEVRRVMQLRAALAGRPAAIPAPAGRVPRPAYLAAAAALVIGLAGAALLLRQPAPSKPVFRAPGPAAFVPEVRATAEGFVAQWPPQPRAASYVVQVLTAEGVPVFEQETEEARASIARRALDPSGPGPVYLSVRALGPHGDVLTSSEPLRLSPAAR